MKPEMEIDLTGLKEPQMNDFSAASVLSFGDALNTPTRTIHKTKTVPQISAVRMLARITTAQRIFLISAHQRMMQRLREARSPQVFQLYRLLSLIWMAKTKTSHSPPFPALPRPAATDSLFRRRQRHSPIGRFSRAY